MLMEELNLSEFPVIEKCNATARDEEMVASDLDGTLVRGRSSFPYFMLMAIETSGILRAWALLLLSPLIWLLYHFVSEAAGIKLLIFISLSGVKVSDIQCVARSVLSKFYLDDLHPEAWRVFSSFGKRIVVTANPRILVESFCKDYLGADEVLGSELEVDSKGRATGFLVDGNVLVGESKAQAVLKACEGRLPEVGLGDRVTDYPFMRLCKEGYLVPPNSIVEKIPRDKLPKQMIFHDGRLVQRPTPLVSLLTLLWFPIGFVLACIRIAAGALLPASIVYYAFRVLGVRVIIRGTPPPPARKGKNNGVLFVCTHRSLLDPIFLYCSIGRRVSAVTYSVSKLSEILSPIKTVPLSRDRERDAAQIRELLKEGDLVICPEGTTCREPFLLRFSALFAELADDIVPVAMNCRMGMFHGTAARAWKGMDPFYFFMNPSPIYEVTFLNQLPVELSCKGGKSSHEVANYIQRVLAGTLNFECTSLTRKDKYRALVGTDGSVAPR